jgi:hypothetical protein
MRVTEHAARRLALRGITQTQVRESMKAARKSGDVSSKIGKYGTPQRIFSANGIRVIVEEDESSDPKLITAYHL